MTLLVNRITDHVNSAGSDPPAFVNFPYYSSPNGRYVASWYSAPSFVCVADCVDLTVVQNFDLGFIDYDSLLLPSVTSFDPHAALIDDDGSLWMAAGDGGGEVFEFPLGELDEPVYRFTLTPGGGNPFEFSRASRAYTMPDASKRLLIVEAGAGTTVYDYHIWNATTSAYTHATLSWLPKCSFQDDNGDLWLAGVANVEDGAITSAYFKRLTNVTGTSAYTAELTFTGLPDIGNHTGGNATGILGCFSDGFFVGGWTPLSQATENYPGVSRADYLIRLNLSDATGKTVVSILDDAPDGLAWVFPNTPIPVNPDFISLAVGTPALSGTIPVATADQRKFGFFNPATLALTTLYDLNDWEAADDLSGFVGDGNPAPNHDAYGNEYLYGLEAFIAQSYGTGFYDPDEPDQKFGKLWLYYTGEEAPEPDDASDDSATLRVWGYSLDGHDYYVLRVGARETLVYDLTTQQWSEWRSPSPRTNWRAHVGGNWVGMRDTLQTFETDVVAGDDSTGTLWILDPTDGRDDLPTTGDEAFARIVTGGIAADGRTSIPCGAVTITLALGRPTQLGASLRLRTSDDFGHTWVNHGDQVVSAGSYDTVVEWRSLGRITQPGRIFEISDNGATVRLGRADMR